MRREQLRLREVLHGGTGPPSPQTCARACPKVRRRVPQSARRDQRSRARVESLRSKTPCATSYYLAPALVVSFRAGTDGRQRAGTVTMDRAREPCALARRIAVGVLVCREIVRVYIPRHCAELERTSTSPRECECESGTRPLDGRATFQTPSRSSYSRRQTSGGGTQPCRCVRCECAQARALHPYVLALARVSIRSAFGQTDPLPAPQRRGPVQDSDRRV